jgi:hypothetical protein
MQLGSMFINNCNNALHVSDAICVHLQEQIASETCRALLQLLINILPRCITLVLYIYYTHLLNSKNNKH